MGAALSGIGSVPVAHQSFIESDAQRFAHFLICAREHGTAVLNPHRPISAEPIPPVTVPAELSLRATEFTPGLQQHYILGLGRMQKRASHGVVGAAVPRHAVPA